MSRALLLCLVLAGCGGGGMPVSIYGASECTLNYIEGGELHQAKPMLVDLLAAEGVEAATHCINGERLAELLDGGPVELSVPATTVMPFAAQLAEDPAERVMVGAGMNDVLFSAITATEFRGLVRRAVAEIRRAGKTPIWRGFNRFVENETITPARQARLAEFEAALFAEAAALDVEVVDVGSVEFLGAIDIRSDGLHATPAYNERIARFLAHRLSGESP